MLWFKVHSSHSLALPLQQQQPLDPVFSLCKEFMADSQFPRAYEIGKYLGLEIQSSGEGLRNLAIPAKRGGAARMVMQCRAAPSDALPIAPDPGSGGQRS